MLQHGLLQGSFVPEVPQQQWRDLTRLRSQLMGRKAQTSNRIQKVLEDANIKLASVASDVLGVSGRDMIQALIAGEQDAKALSNLARRRLKNKQPQLEEALLGRVSEHHRFLLRILMEELAATEKAVSELEARLEEVMAPFAEEIRLLDTIPGVNVDLARVILAEVGPEMKQFPSGGHLCSWAGMCPGNHQSAGKRKSGKTNRGNRWLRSALVQAGWAGSRKKQSCLSSLYGRLVSRRGKKRAVVACGASILNSVHYMLSRRQGYVDLGADHYERTQGQRMAKNLVKRLEAQGYTVTLTRAA
jgi:transposase